MKYEQHNYLHIYSYVYKDDTSCEQHFEKLGIVAARNYLDYLL